MEPRPTLAPCLIGDGTVSSMADMVRALETVETCRYAYTVHGEPVSAGRATLVKILVDDSSSTILVNGCLFLNIASFRYLNFHTDEEGAVRIELHGDESTLDLFPIDEPDLRVSRPVIRLIERDVFDPEPLLRSDEDEDE
jgi:hypothetical protein